MEITSFDDLLQAARQQPEPQRLLFVFAGAELPDECRPRFSARSSRQGEGGELAPLMCVDKAPAELVRIRRARRRGGAGGTAVVDRLRGGHVRP